MKETESRQVERALVVGLLLPRDDRWEAEESLQELDRLASTAGFAGSFYRERAG
jgi:hypothetical protein